MDDFVTHPFSVARPASRVFFGLLFASSAAMAGSLPVVSMTSPASGTSFLSPGTIVLQATASSSGSTISNITYMDGAAKIATVSTGPSYTYNWKTALPGSHTLTAIAKDKTGATTISQGSTVLGLSYDGHGRRVQETLNGAVTKVWVWCGNELCEERDATGAVQKRFYSQGEQVANVSYFFARDQLGSVREMTDQAGAVHAELDYDPYGRQSRTSGDMTPDLGFTGDYLEASSGLNLTLHRAYDPNLGRWLSKDVIGEEEGINLYLYVRNNPIRGVDPLGLCLCDTIASKMDLLNTQFQNGSDALNQLLDYQYQSASTLYGVDVATDAAFNLAFELISAPIKAAKAAKRAEAAAATLFGKLMAGGYISTTTTAVGKVFDAVENFLGGGSNVSMASHAADIVSGEALKKATTEKVAEQIQDTVNSMEDQLDDLYHQLADLRKQYLANNCGTAQ